MPSYSAENLNKSKRANRLYKDLDLDFGRNIATSDVNKLTNVEAVKRALRNLINLQHFEKPFHPEIGSSIRTMLFEPMNPLTSLNIQRKIEEVISNYEPRVKLNQILATPDYDGNRYDVRIMFYVIGTSQPVEIQTFLERLR
jgi:hypothetical protein